MKLGKMATWPWRMIGTAIGIFAGGIIIGYLIHSYFHRTPAITVVRDPQNGYALINPILYTEVPESNSYPKYSSLKTALNNYIAGAKQKGNARDVSVYYRDLIATQWVGIDADKKYNPASMLKVITLIGILQANETNPAILSGRISVPAHLTIPTAGGQLYYPPANPVESGNTYAISDLLQRMIVQSDNGANALLISFLGDGATSANYENLHIPLPSQGNIDDVSPQEYSRIFRILYNSSYLTEADSEKALQLLSHTTFTSGLVAGVPAGTTVAHKFGEDQYPAQSPSDPPTGIPGLNDCGIIYYPHHPYVLCVMTKGKDFPTLANVIKDISHITWQQVQAVYPQ